MRNFVKFFILFFVILNFQSCMDNDGDPYYFFYDEPAIVESLGDSMIVRTAYGKFCVPSLKNDILQKNDVLWSSFTVEKKDENKIQMSGNQSYYKAAGFRYDKVDSAKVIIPANTQEFESCLADNYKETIGHAVLYKTYVDSLLFFGFEHGSSTKAYEYELFLNPEIENSNGHPTLYIRAKQKEGFSNLHQNRIIYAFEMTAFIDYCQKKFSEKNTLQFNLKYYIETRDGKDIYREFLSNPLSWRLK